MFGQARQVEWDEPEATNRVYTVCLFRPGAVVPDVKLVDAECDERAIAIARMISPGAEREVWDRHRLVAHFPSALEQVAN